MKPLKLIITAFGPYKKTEIVDFSELEQNNLFVISGNTGAGKTTIFDAICFALYGSASGTDRENNAMLRSDFADDDTHTSVELEYELHGRTYRVLRQLGHIKQGNKSKTGERYEFYEKVGGQEVPCVDRQIVSEIDKKTEALLGLTQDQFKQIVMLPQGEFRKLLTSKTENKEEILRRLFKTDTYRQISDRLKMKKNQAEEIFNQELQKQDHYIQSIASVLPERDGSPLFHVLSGEHYNVNQIAEGMENEVAFYRNQIVEDEKLYQKAYLAHGKKQKEFSQAEAWNERFSELEKKEKQLEKMNGQIPLFAQKEKQLEAADRASRIEVLERNANDWRKEEKNKSNQLANAEIASKKTDENLAKAQNTYDQEEKRKDEREMASKRLDRLQEFFPTVKAIDQEKAKLAKRNEQVKEIYNELEQVKSNVLVLRKQMEKDELKISEMDKAVMNLPDTKMKLDRMREQARLLKKYLELKEKQTKLDKDVGLKENAFRDLKTEYDQLEELWLNSQASVLASHLYDGEACPVCGSLEHPNKAVKEAETATKEELEALKKEWNKKEKLFQDVLINRNSNSSQIKEKREELMPYGIDLGNADAIYAQVIEKGKQLKKVTDDLGKLRNELQTLKDQQEKAKKEIKQMEEKKERFEKTYYEQKSAFESSEAVHEEKLRSIPKDVRVLANLEQQIKETTAHKSKLEKAWDAAQQTLQKRRDEQTKAASDMISAKKQLAETKVKREQYEKQFSEALANAGFAMENAYQQAKLPESGRQKLKEDIHVFNQGLATLKHNVSELKESLQGKVKVDLSELQQQLTKLKHHYEQALEKKNLSEKYHQGALDLKLNIEQAHEQVLVFEKQLAVMTDLYDVIRGQNNRKISFERYLQMEYLEQIIDAANMRLKGLSNGQYLLMRSDRQESHGRQSGLGLDVYDSYTGQMRDVKTLSGGEKFNAALCLALGMSDVVQSFQGNVSIKTMFIDEGFGSLDEESLHKSIETLADLQKSGRMIGVISHVQDLKAMFPAILEVSKAKEGYSKTRFVLK